MRCSKSLTNGSKYLKSITQPILNFQSYFVENILQRTQIAIDERSRFSSASTKRYRNVQAFGREKLENLFRNWTIFFSSTQYESRLKFGSCIRFYLKRTIQNITWELCVVLLQMQTTKQVALHLPGWHNIINYNSHIAKFRL